MELFLKIILMVLYMPGLIAQPGSEWFSRNDRGNRYEGSYSRKVSNPSINIVSLTGHMDSYDFGKEQTLQIHFFNPDQSEYQLKAEELSVTQFYWMQDKNKEAQTGWNTFGDWPVDYLLKRFLIDRRNLGILVRLGSAGSRKFTPAFVYTTEQSLKIERYVAMLRLGRAASDGSYKIYTGKGGTKQQLIKEQKLFAKSSGIVFPIVIPAKELRQKAVWVTVEVNLREKNTLDPFTYSFSFYYQPK